MTLSCRDEKLTISLNFLPCASLKIRRDKFVVSFLAAERHHPSND